MRIVMGLSWTRPVDGAAMLPQCDTVRQSPRPSHLPAYVINLSLNCNLYITGSAYGGR
jgi:hypothetical protein